MKGRTQKHLNGEILLRPTQGQESKGRIKWDVMLTVTQDIVLPTLDYLPFTVILC